jgi:hypothetical protein
MTFEEYKSVLDKIHKDVKYHSNPRTWKLHPLFESLVTDENARIHIYELLMDNPSWVVLCLVHRIFPEMPFPEHYAGLYNELRNYYMTWIEEHA